MTSEARYDFDTNVIVSAMRFEHSITGRAFYEALDRGDLLSRAHSAVGGRLAPQG